MYFYLQMYTSHSVNPSSDLRTIYERETTGHRVPRKAKIISNYVTLSCVCLPPLVIPIVAAHIASLQRAAVSSWTMVGGGRAHLLKPRAVVRVLFDAKSHRVGTAFTRAMFLPGSVHIPTSA